MSSDQSRSGIRRWLAYVIHPDTPLWRAADGECEFDDVVEQGRQLEYKIREAEERSRQNLSTQTDELDHIADVQNIAREWDRLKQKLGVKYR